MSSLQNSLLSCARARIRKVTFSPLAIKRRIFSIARSRAARERHLSEIVYNTPPVKRNSRAPALIIRVEVPCATRATEIHRSRITSRRATALQRAPRASPGHDNECRGINPNERRISAVLKFDKIGSLTSVRARARARGAARD